MRAFATWCTGHRKTVIAIWVVALVATGMIAGSVGPYGASLADGSEYHGHYDIPLAELRAWHRPRIDRLAEAGVDLLALETVPCLVEAEALLAELAWGFQDAVVDVLATKTLRAAESTAARGIVLGGGVAANDALRERIEAGAAARGIRVVIPRPGLCTDNGAMIAWAGAERMAIGLTDTMEAPPRARWLLDANAKAPAGHANSRAGH